MEGWREGGRGREGGGGRRKIKRDGGMQQEGEGKVREIICSRNEANL